MNGFVYNHFWSLVTLLVVVLGGSGRGFEPSPWSQNGNDGKHGGFLPFPQGLAPDGTRYKTDYHCEGQNMTVSCTEDKEHKIEVVRGNFGRFSIAICNRHGNTEWSVNCMAPETTDILKQKCDGLKECVIPVRSSLFPDACPGTMKYLEIHYACRGPPRQDKITEDQQQQEKLPPWLVKKPRPGQHQWAMNNNENENNNNNNNNVDLNDNTIRDDSSSKDASLVTTTTPRKPILVTERTSTTSTKTTTSTQTSSTPAKDTEMKEEEEKMRKEKPRLIQSNQKNLASAVFDDEEKADKVVEERKIMSPNNLLPSKKDFKEIPTPKLNIPKASPSPSTTNWCAPTTSRQLQWDWTEAGKIVVQPCPIGATGHAQWQCGQDSNQWTTDQPDMSNCKTVAMSNLETQVRKEDPENVLVSALAYLTRTKSLYGGDLETAVATLRTVASRISFRLQQTSFHNKESHIRQVLQNVFRSANNILEPSNAQAWKDLSHQNRLKIVSQLLLSLEENAFLLAGVVDEPDEILESSDILTMSISVLNSWKMSRDSKSLNFPLENNGNLLYVDDSVVISTQDLADNARAGDISEVIFFSFSNLHEIMNSGIGSRFNLHDGRNSGLSINSRIVSASINRPGRHVQLAEPAEIVLRHLKTNMSDAVCVYWDLELNLWSDSGCEVLATNSTVTRCQCDHLTNFAVAARMTEVSGLSLFFQGLYQRLDVITSVIAAVVVFAMVLIFVECRHKLGENRLCSSCCGCCFKTNEIRKSQSFYTGLTASASNSSSSNINKSCRIPISSNDNSTMMKNGLVNGTANSRTLLLNNSLRAQSQYVLSTQQMQPGSIRVASSNNNNNLNNMSRPHITLNPYSTQLVDNINLMMGGNGSASSSSQSNSLSHQSSGNSRSDQFVSSEDTQREEVVYRSVSPHGHVYWEIDPTSVVNHNSSQFAQHDPLASAAHLDEMNTFRNQNRFINCAENHPLLGQQQHVQQHVQQQPQFIRTSSSMDFGSQSPMRNNSEGSFVRTGAGRYNRRTTMDRTKRGEQQQQQQQQLNNVPEQLQTQVQIRDIKPIQVSVKSSEYIEAKIRTLRKNNNNNNNNNNLSGSQNQEGHQNFHHISH